MSKVVPIVEGHGDVGAVPVLCYKLLRDSQRYDVQVDVAIDAKGRSNLTKKGGLEQLIERAWNRPGCNAVLILVDADDNCAVHLARDFTRRILAMGNPRCAVVVAVAAMEYEAWFLAIMETLAGQIVRDGLMLPIETSFTGDVEAIRDVKAWITSQLPRVGGYRRVAYDEAQDQLTMTRLIDPTLARANSRSFRRLCHAIEQILDAVDNNKIVVTPEAV